MTSTKPSQDAPVSAAGWLPALMAALLTVAALTFGWAVGGGGGPSRGLGDGPWQGHMHDGPPEFRTLTGTVLTVIGLTVGAVVAQHRWLRAGFVGTLTGLVLYGMVGGPVPAVVAPAAITTLRFVRRLGLQRAGYWLPLVVPAVWAGAWDEPALGLTNPEVWWGIVTAVVWIGVPTLVMLLVRGRRQAATQARREELERVAHAERLRVVRDIHDVVGHSLSLITLQSGVALRVLDDDPAQARGSLEAIRDVSKQALADVRHALGVVRGDDEVAPRSPTPGLDDIKTLVGETRRGGVDVALSMPSPVVEVPVSVGAVAYRVVQEGLTNAIRHASGARVEVDIALHGDVLCVVLADRGRPPPVIVEGSGLTGMRERVTSVGGHLVVQPSESGLTLRADLLLTGRRTGVP